MSRRHKEKEIDKKISQPQPVEPVADCRQQTTDDSTVQVLEGLRDVLEQPQCSISRKKKLRYSFSKYLDSFEKALREALANFTFDSKSIDALRSIIPFQFSIEHEQSFQTILEQYRALIKDALLKELEDYSPPPDEEDESRGRGRPVIKRLCSKFRDEKIWPLAKDIFRKIHNESIQRAKNLAQYLVCFLCSLFRFSNEVIDGRVTHFHRLMKEHFQKTVMPSLRKLQQGVQWLRDKTKTFFRNKNSEKEELRHQAWEALTQQILGHLGEFAPLYAN